MFVTGKVWQRVACCIDKHFSGDARCAKTLVARKIAFSRGGENLGGKGGACPRGIRPWGATPDLACTFHRRRGKRRKKGKEGTNRFFPGERGSFRRRSARKSANWGGGWGFFRDTRAAGFFSRCLKSPVAGTQRARRLTVSP